MSLLFNSSLLIKVAFFDVMSLFLDVLARRPEITHTSNPSNNEQSEEHTADSNGGNCIHGWSLVCLVWPDKTDRLNASLSVRLCRQMAECFTPN